MNNYNHFTCIGTLTKDAEINKINEENVVLIIMYALNRKTKVKEGYKDIALFMKASYWGTEKELQPMLEYMKTGNKIFMTGYLEPKSWVSNGVKRNSIELRALQLYPVTNMYHKINEAKFNAKYPPEYTKQNEDTPEFDDNEEVPF